MSNAGANNADAEVSQAAGASGHAALEHSVHSEGSGDHHQHGHHHHHHHQHRAKRHKPEKIEKLQVDGSNWPAWRSRIEDFYIFENCLHVLKVAAVDNPHRSRDLQNGYQIIKDNIVDGLLPFIAPPGVAVAPTPAAAMLRLEQEFGGVQKEIVQQQRRLLNNLVQGASEDVRAYLRRAQEINVKMVMAGGVNSDSDLLEFIKSGLQRQFENTVDLFESSPDCANLAVLTNKLVQQEMRVARHAAQDFAGATIPTGQQQGQGRSQGRGQGRGQQPGRGRGQQQQQGAGGNKWESEAYIAAGKTAICFNCGVLGHRVAECPQQPVTLPLRFRGGGRGGGAGRGRGAGPAAGAAPPALNA